MKKEMFHLAAVFICMVFLTIPVTADTLPGSSVYASSEEQEAVMEIIGQKADFSYLKEAFGLSVNRFSVSPVYTADYFAYGKTGKWQISRMKRGNQEGWIHPDGNVYMAELVTADGRYGGTVRFSIEDGAAAAETVTLLPEYTGTEAIGVKPAASCYYEALKYKIADALGRSDPVPEQNVRYVVVDGIGNAFYICDEKTEAFVYPGREGQEKLSVLKVDEELREKAVLDDQIAQVWQQLYDEWYKYHPEDIPYGENNTTLQEKRTRLAELNRELENLHAAGDPSVAKNDEGDRENGYAVYLFAGLVLAASAAAVCFFVFRRRRTERMQAA